MIRALIIANGEIKDYTKVAKKLKDYTFNYVICCDGGVKHLKYLGITPNYIIGDFDSADGALVQQYRELGSKIEEFEVDKDFTDSELGVNKAIDLDCNESILIGGTGGRIDHTMANLNLGLLALSNNCNLIIVDELNVVHTVIEKIEIKNKAGQNCSIMPITLELEGVTTKGLKYSLNNESVYLGQSRTVSNLVLDDVAEITISKGVAFVILS